MSNTTEHFIVRLDADLKKRLKVRAALSHTDMSKIAREAIANHLRALERADRGRQIVQELSGRAGPGMSTDEIMALTRGE